MRKVTLVKAMCAYFSAKGHTMSLAEYTAANDGPYHPATIRKVCGSWVKMLHLCKQNYPELLEPRKPVPITPAVYEQPVKAPISAAEALAMLEGRLNEE
jgi:hypothetical protein